MCMCVSMCVFEDVSPCSGMYNTLLFIILADVVSAHTAATAASIHERQCHTLSLREDDMPQQRCRQLPYRRETN